MNIGGKTKFGITLSLGVLVGLGLVVLPGLFATPTSNSTPPSANTKAPTPTYTVGTNNPANQSSQPALTPTTIGNQTFTIALILFPAISLSIFVRYWTLKGTKNKLESEKQ